MFADTDKTVFVARAADGSIYGLWTVRQFPDQEELLESDPQVVALLTRPLPPAKLTDGELADMLIAKGLITAQDVAQAVSADRLAIDKNL